MGPFTQFLQICIEFFPYLWIGGLFHLRQMVNYHAQVGNQVRQPDDRCNQFRTGVGRVHFKACRRKLFEPVDEIRILKLSRQVPSPKVAATNAAKKRIAMESFQVFAEVRLLGLQIAYSSHNHRGLGGNVQHPLVVFQPGATFNFNGPHNPQTLCHLQVPSRQSRFV